MCAGEEIKKERGDIERERVLAAIDVVVTHRLLGRYRSFEIYRYIHILSFYRYITMNTMVMMSLIGNRLVYEVCLMDTINDKLVTTMKPEVDVRTSNIYNVKYVECWLYCATVLN